VGVGEGRPDSKGRKRGGGGFHLPVKSLIELASEFSAPTKVTGEDDEQLALAELEGEPSTCAVSKSQRKQGYSSSSGARASATNAGNDGTSDLEVGRGLGEDEGCTRSGKTLVCSYKVLSYGLEVP